MTLEEENQERYILAYQALDAAKLLRERVPFDVRWTSPWARMALTKAVKCKLTDDGKCPACKKAEHLANATGERNRFCGYCGQAIEWDKENEND